MDFDLCEHRIRQIAIEAARLIRKANGLPEEKNITVLFNEVAPLLGIPVIKLNSRVADHIPSPAEMKDDNGRLILPRRDCPSPVCNGKESAYIVSICPKCKDSEGGKFNSGWSCGICGLIWDKSEKFFTQRMHDEFPDIVIPSGSKLSLGIKTITNDGLK